jgi:hypothetical protein
MGLILMIIQTALSILQQQTGGNAGVVVADSLVDIISKAMAAYKEQTGKDIDISLIKPYEPIP